MSMMVSFCAVLFPRGVLDEILNLIESVSEGFPSYFFSAPTSILDAVQIFSRLSTRHLLFQSFSVNDVGKLHNVGAIFNFNKPVPDLDIETCNPDS